MFDGVGMAWSLANSSATAIGLVGVSVSRPKRTIVFIPADVRSRPFSQLFVKRGRTLGLIDWLGLMPSTLGNARILACQEECTKGQRFGPDNAEVDLVFFLCHRR